MPTYQGWVSHSDWKGNIKELKNRLPDKHRHSGNLRRIEEYMRSLRTQRVQMDYKIGNEQNVAESIRLAKQVMAMLAALQNDLGAPQC